MLRWINQLKVPPVLLRIGPLLPFLHFLSRLRRRIAPRPYEFAIAPLSDDNGRLGGLREEPGAALGRLLSSGSPDRVALLTLADGLRASGRHEEAIVAARQAVKHYPEDVASWLCLGRIERALLNAPSSATTRIPGLTHQERQELEAVFAVPDEARLPSTVDPGDRAASTEQAIADLERENVQLARIVTELQDATSFQCGPLETWIRYEHTKYFMRNLSLFMYRDGKQSPVGGANAEIPKNLVGNFTMSGRIPLHIHYLNAAYTNVCRDTYTDFDVDQYLSVWRTGALPNATDQLAITSYSFYMGAVDSSIKAAVTSHIQAGQSVAVLESRGPVYEALSLMASARPTSIRRVPAISRTERIRCVGIADWQRGRLTFDAAIAVAAVEQAGLGMHGESIDPDGDFQQMLFLKNIVKPGGLLFLVVPTGSDCVLFNTNRIYGEIRLPLLLQGWLVLDQFQHTEQRFHELGDSQSLFVLKNQS